MTLQKFKDGWGHLVNWILGGVCAVLLMMNAFFLSELYKEFKSFGNKLTVFNINLEVVESRVDNHTGRIEKLEDYKERHSEQYRRMFEIYNFQKR